jgi:hypothetical protein
MGGRSDCSYQSISYDKIIVAVLDALRGYEYVPPRDDVGSELWGIGEAISALADDIEDLRGSIKVNKNSPSLRQALTAKMLEMDEMKTEQARLKQLSRPLNAKLVEGAIIALLRDGLVDNQRLRQAIARVNIDFNNRSLEVVGHEGTMLGARIDFEIPASPL